MTQVDEVKAPAAPALFDESAEMDRALDSIFGDNEQEPEPAAPTEEVESAAPVEETTPEPKAASPALEKARNAARLAGFDAETVEGMSEAALSGFHSKWSKREGDLNARLARLAEYERERQETPATTGAERKPTANPVDLSVIPAAITEELGADTAKALLSWIEAKVAPLQAALGQAQQANLKTAVERELDAMRAAGELGDGLPDGALESILHTAEALQGVAGPWSSLEGQAKGRALLKHAALAQYGGFSNTKAETESKEIAHAARNGKATSVKSRQVTRVPLSDEEFEAGVLDVIFAGGDVEAYKRKHGR